jgi:hypothetical protein
VNARAARRTFFYFLVLRSGVRVGPFVPARYLRQAVENSDFRKYDDALRMVLDCTPAFADALEERLRSAAVLHAAARTQRSCAFHRRRAGRLCHGRERAEGERGSRPRVSAMPIRRWCCRAVRRYADGSSVRNGLR